MGNVARILKRDILRLLKAPAALIVVGALMVLPSLYTWYNVVAFWNPYEATGNLRVCVVNQDAGAENKLTGEIDVGSLVSEELLANDKLDFVSEGLDEAMADLEAGSVYAVYVIPENFSSCLISPLTGTIERPVIKYYANEKLGPVSPKITDTAANTLEETINSTFVETVSEKAAQIVDDAIKDAKTDETAARKRATEAVDSASTAVADVREKLADAKTALSKAKSKTKSAVSDLDEALDLVDDTDVLLADVADETAAVQTSLTKASTGAVGPLSGVVAELSKITTKGETVADRFLAKAGSAQAYVDMACGRVQPFIDTASEISQELKDAAAKLPDGEVKTKIQNAADKLAGEAAKLQSEVDAITALSAKIEKTAQTASDAAHSLDDATKQISDSLEDYSDDLFNSTLPTITACLSEVSTACTSLTAAASDLKTTIGEAQAGLRQLDGLLGDCEDALGQTDSVIGNMQTDVKSIAADIKLLAQSDAIADLVEGGSLNAQNIGEFMGSPTKLEKIQMYHPNAYGTAMAPLFMNLTFWIGAFMLVIIFRTEVDDEGIKKLTLGQRYLSRLILFAGIAVVQAAICCAGVLVLGVQVASVSALFLAAMVTSLAYTSIIYALSTTLQHIGKALCIILVFAQIPGGSGLYPLELTDKFFQTIYPFLPFSYGIGALREAICGFYGNYYVQDLMVLAFIFVSMIVLGMVVGPLMSNVTRMAAQQIREGDLYNGEDALVPERPYRLSQVVNALSDQEGFRESLERRYARFSKLYPVFLRVLIALAVCVPVALAFLLALDAGEKVVLITIVLVWLVALLISVLIVESHRYSLERQLNLERLSGDGALKLFFNRERLVPMSADEAKGTAPLGEEAVATDETAAEANSLQAKEDGDA